jgi:hypothetical protein
VNDPRGVSDCIPRRQACLANTGAGTLLPSSEIPKHDYCRLHQSGAPVSGWLPSSPIVVGGAGIWFASPTCFVENGANITTPPASGKRVTYGAGTPNDYGQLVNAHTGSTRTLRTNCAGLEAASWFVATANGAQGAAGDPVNGPVPHGYVPLRVHQGAQLTQAVLTFFVGQTHANVPQHLPRFLVSATDQFGNVILFHVGTSSNGDTSGFIQPPPPASGAAWFNGGAAQTMVFNPNNPVNPVIDRTKYIYTAEIIDESGTNALSGNLYSDVTLLFSGIADTRPA